MGKLSNANLNFFLTNPTSITNPASPWPEAWAPMGDKDNFSDTLFLEIKNQYP